MAKLMTRCVRLDMSMFSDYGNSKLKIEVSESRGWNFAEARTEAKGADVICSKLLFL